MKLGTIPTKTKIPLGTRLFGFSSKTSFFAGLGALFGTFLVILKKKMKNEKKRGFNVRKIKDKIRKNEKRKNVRTRANGIFIISIRPILVLLPILFKICQRCYVMLKNGMPFK